MNFDTIFSLTTLVAYLRYPQIEGLGDELLPEGSRLQLTRKRTGIDSTTSGLPLPEGKKSKVSSEVLPRTTSEPSRLSHLQLSLPKEMAVPRKSRYDKGKNKVSQNLLEDSPVVNSLGPLRAEDGKGKTTILDFLTGTHPSREITVPIRENNPLVIPSREITLSIEESNPSGIPPPGVLHPLCLLRPQIRLTSLQQGKLKKPTKLKQRSWNPLLPTRWVEVKLLHRYPNSWMTRLQDFKGKI
jgi:hypothetical protein